MDSGADTQRVGIDTQTAFFFLPLPEIEEVLLSVAAGSLFPRFGLPGHSSHNRP